MVKWTWWDEFVCSIKAWWIVMWGPYFCLFIGIVLGIAIGLDIAYRMF